MDSIGIGVIYLLAGIVLGAASSMLMKRSILKISEQQEELQIELNSKFNIIIATGIGIIYALVYYFEGISYVSILDCAVILLLAAVVVIDTYTFEIPFIINVGIFILGLIKMGLDINHWSLYIIGFFAVSGFLCLLYYISKGRWIGGGDVKLMAAAGIFLGWKLILVAFIVGCVAGSVIHLSIMAIHKGERMLALGPYLSLGIMFSMIWGEQLASWYLGLLRI